MIILKMLPIAISQPSKKLLFNATFVLFPLLINSGYWVFGQRENNNWIFGDRAGISFNTNPPSIIQESQIATDEGVATISDSNGNLQFYTDGSSVWNSKHQIMPNGRGLSGHYSSTQSALITSDPGNCDKYYIFTTDGIENNLANGLQYNIVNMRLNNGLGDIEIKNIQLFSPVAEKLVAIPNPVENSIWLIAHQWNSNNFKIYKISSDGIELTRTQNIGEYHGGNLINAVGYMKASPNGNSIAIINRSISSAEIFRFDNTTGSLSNNLTIGSQFNQLYGLEFSPDGSNLFVGTSGQIFQFKIDPYIQSNITTSKTLITTSQKTIRALQLAPDGKIYVAFNNQSYIGVINKPNLIGGSSDFYENGLNLSGICKFGLPTKTVGKSGSGPIFELGNDTTLCSGETIVKDISVSQGSYLWQDGTTNPKYTISQPGTYIASATNNCGVHSDTITVKYRNFDQIKIPNVFTPNEDGYNDFFVIDEKLIGSSIMIINRWGKVIYNSPNYQNDWEAEGFSSGIYYYYITDVCGANYKGWLQVLR